MPILSDEISPYLVEGFDSNLPQIFIMWVGNWALLKSISVWKV